MQGKPQARLVVSAARRKASAVARRVPRRVARLRAGEADYARRPPVVVTTIPKSGTHLVHQIVETLPGTVDYGTFLATTVSWRRRPRSVAALVRRIRALAPGEILRAHLIHTPEVVDALAARNAFVVFVYRDPRDVITSEVHYLADSAPWHALHRTFSRLEPEERIDLAITGLPGSESLYPDVARRYAWYEGWLEDASVAVSFEDLVGEDRNRVVQGLVSRFNDVRHAGDGGFDVDTATRRAIDAIAPERSHTYREGRTGGWRDAFSPAQVETFDRIAGDILHRYGYVR